MNQATETNFDELVDTSAVKTFPDFKKGGQFRGDAFPEPARTFNDRAENTRGIESSGELAQVGRQVRPRLFDVFLQERARIRDTRLLDGAGIAAVAKELGITFEGNIVAPNNASEFCTACTNADPNQAALADALIVVAAGQLAIDGGSVPNFVYNEREHAIHMYLGALELVDDWLDAHGQNGAPPPESLQKSWNRRWKNDWKAAVGAASEFEDKTIRAFRDLETGEDVLCGKDDSSLVHVYDSKGNSVGNYTTFVAKQGKFLDQKDLQQRPLEAQGLLATEAKTLRELLFTQWQYPDQSVIDNIDVKHIVAVLPLLPEEERVLFRMLVDSQIPQQQLEIITAGKWHTKQDTRQLFTPEQTGLVGFGLPGFSGQDQFFYGAPTSALGAKRKGEAAAVGDAASKSVVIVMKPTVSPAKAEIRKSCIRWQNGLMQDRVFARLMCDCSDSDDIEQLTQLRGLSPEQVHALTEAICAIHQEQINRTSSSGSFRGGASNMYSFGNLRSGGSGLHTGDSGRYSGFEYGKMQDRRVPDPFTSPSIIVVHPYGVTGKEPEDMPGNLAGLLAQN